MNIGDKVRALHEDIEGYISKFLPNDIIEIEIEDGFGIPVHKKELVLVSSQEAEYFEEGKETPQKTTPRIAKTTVEKGIYMIFEPLQGDKLVKMRLYNNTSHKVIYSAFEKVYESYNFSTGGVMLSKDFADGKVYTLENFEEWPSFVFQFAVVPEKSLELPRYKLKEFKLKASVFFKSKTSQTPLGYEGYSFQIDQSAVNIDAEALREQMTQSKKSSLKEEKINAVSEIDLHAEALGLSSFLAKNEYLKQQLQAFEKALDNAIRANLEEVTFIHGIGNGKLQFEIQKTLSKHPNVSTFTDAQKEKFGYGATKALLK